MFRPINIIGIAVFFILGLFSFGFAQESITITTYYPSPYGSYNELTTTGNTNLATSSGSVGIGTTNPMGRLHVFAANNSTAQMITINAAQASITSADTFIDFRSTTGSEGSIAGTATPGLIAYNTFTGSHWTKIDNKKGLFPNMLLEAIGEKFDNGKRQLVKTRICTSRKSQAIYGVYGGSDEKGRDLVLALGTGYIWVTNTNGDIAVGDYLQSSPLPGYAEKQEDNILHNYTAAKALEPVIWKKGETKRLIACTYHSG